MMTNSRYSIYSLTRQGAEITKSSHFDYEFDLGHKIVFICVAKGDPAPRITWFKDGIEIFSHPYLQVGSESAVSHLHVCVPSSSFMFLSSVVRTHKNYRS